MAKAIGYLIGLSFVVGIIFGPALGLYWASKETFTALSYDKKETAIIENCRSIRSKGVGRRGSKRFKRVPVVTLQSGQKVIGKTGEVRFFWRCNDQVGKKVEVLYDEKTPTKAKINTFFEMWFSPIIMLLVCAVVYPALVMGYIKKFRK